MRRDISLGVAIATILAGAQAAAARPIVRPCRPGTPAHAQAAAQLEEVSAAILRLAPADDPKPAIGKLEALGQLACFEIIGELTVEAANGLALKSWWESGGHAHAASALDLGGRTPSVWIRPDVRRTLTRETAPRHRLAPLLCPASDETCGRETDGWRTRAEAALEQAATIRRLRDEGEELPGWKRARPPTDDDCDGFARRAPVGLRFERYRSCLESTAERAPAFPIGRVRAPTNGWLIVSGRRGHHTFCDELRAFDLATGASYRVATCSGLALEHDGSVNHRATDAGRRNELERGSVSLDAIREAAWMLVQVPDIERSVLADGFGRDLPAGIAVRASGGGTLIGGLGSVVSMSSADTRLVWRVTSARAGDDLGTGSLTWPQELNDDAAAHALLLLKVAEASFKPGCPAALPPPDVETHLQSLSAHHLDTDAASLGKAAGDMKAAWRKLLAERCPGNLK